MLKNVFIKKMKENLLHQKQEIISNSTRIVDIDVDGDETDGIQGNLLLEVSNQLHTRNSTKLNQIIDALKKMEDKTYGLCEDCGEDIPEKRLMFNPYFLTCVSCAEDREIEEKQEKRF